MLQAIDSDGVDTEHIHSIVVKIGKDVAAFDINGLLDILTGTSMEELHPELESKHVPSTYTSPDNAFRKISSIYRMMGRYAARGGPQIPSIANRRAPRNTAEGRAALQSRTVVRQI